MSFDDHRPLLKAAQRFFYQAQGHAAERGFLPLWFDHEGEVIAVEPNRYDIELRSIRHSVIRRANLIGAQGAFFVERVGDRLHLYAIGRRSELNGRWIYNEAGWQQPLISGSVVPDHLIIAETARSRPSGLAD